ncbi:tetratricopeptide repeat protein [Photobacterium minamisatsumaniensis]|uniref:tetratricopeptide repeat protein n=1 Tax=Photobacterium minamisatsumaniensis TaxID=2910233 RepID=UPI003D0A257E
MSRWFSIHCEGAFFIPLLISLFTLGAVGTTYAKTTHDQIGEGIQLIQQGQLNEAKAQLNSTAEPYKGEALFLAARIAEFEHNWAQSMAYYRQYLSGDPFSVHRLEARAAFALLRTYHNDPLLIDYFYLIQLRDQNALGQMQQASARLYAINPTQPLAIRGQLLMAHSLLELGQEPQKALKLYIKIADDTVSMEADWYIQAMFGAVFSALRDQQNTMAKNMFAQLQAKLDSNWSNRNSLLARSWQQRIDAMVFMFSLLQEETSQTTAPFLWGVGARLLLDKPVGSGQHFAPIWKTLSAHALGVRSVTLWITQDSDWHWLRTDLLRGAHANGYIPMINYWFFGDKISPDYVQANRKRYLDEIENKLIPLLRDLPQAYLILEPEFNKQGIETWDGWDPLMLEVIALLRKHVPQVKIGLGLGDWDQPGSTPSYASAQKSIEASDFVASMLMLASYTERAHSAPDWSAWVRALRLGERLQKRFNKPWMLAYLSIASQPNWEAQQANELHKLHFYLPMLRKLGLFALNWFSFTDEPQQQGWFADAEQSFGLLDADYRPKAAFDTYKQLIDKHRTEEIQAPNLEQFIVTNMAEPRLKPLQVKAEFTHWTPWELTVAQGENEWVQRGVGDAILLHWHGQMLPSWADSGPLSVTLKINGKVVKKTDAFWQGIENNRFVVNEEVTLDTWHTWQRSLLQSIDAAQLGLRNSGSVELVLTGLRPEQLSALYVGLIDSHGFSQTLSVSGYAYAKGNAIAINIPLADFGQNWVKFENDTPTWRNLPNGSIDLVLQNSSLQPISFKVSALHSLLPE